MGKKFSSCGNGDSNDRNVVVMGTKVVPVQLSSLKFILSPINYCKIHSQCDYPVICLYSF